MRLSLLRRRRSAQPKRFLETLSMGYPSSFSMAEPPAMVAPVAEPSVWVVVWAFDSREGRKLMSDVMAGGWFVGNDGRTLVFS